MNSSFKLPKAIILILIIVVVTAGLYFLLTKKLTKDDTTALTAPPGFKVSVFAEGLGSAGAIAFDPSGNVAVSDYRSGKIFLIEKGGGNKKILLDGLNQPFGLAFYTDTENKVVYLYVAETNQVARYAYDASKSEIRDKKGENIATLPAGGLNSLRNILFGPNLRTSPAITGYLEKETLSAVKLYIGVGSSCDVCVEDSWKRGAVLESDADGNYTAELAGGLRNPLFFAVQPGADKIWATDQNGRDLPGEINLLKAGKKYGWPFCFGNKIKDENFNPPKFSRTDIPTNCRETEAPLIEIPAGFTPYGLAFVPLSAEWPEDWRGNMLVAFNSADGSSFAQAGGSKIVVYKIGTDGRPAGSAEDFILDWDGSKKLGRPVDLKFGPDGALYVTDDVAGVIYKVEYRGAGGLSK